MMISFANNKKALALLIAAAASFSSNAEECDAKHPCGCAVNAVENADVGDEAVTAVKEYCDNSADGNFEWQNWVQYVPENAMQYVEQAQEWTNMDWSNVDNWANNWKKNPFVQEHCQSDFCKTLAAEVADDEDVGEVVATTDAAADDSSAGQVVAVTTGVMLSGIFAAAGLF